MTFISFNRQDLDQAIQEATAAAHTKRQQERVAKAVTWLSTWGGNAWVLRSDTITIRSSSSDDIYTLVLGEFTEHRCKSTRPCWHLSLATVIMAANQLREDREALEYGVWYPNLDCCGGQGCSKCLITVAPAVMPARVALEPAVITNEAEYEVIPW